MTRLTQSILIVLSILVISCSTPTGQEADNTATESTPPPRELPASLDAAFKAHGGLSNWDKMRTLEFDVAKSEVTEHHVVDLKSRKVLITSENYQVGFDGKDVWVTPDSAAFDGNARFYHNLYFYFYALPYLAADPGVNYKELGPVTVNGQEYTKLLMTFNEDVGDSPDDQYILYFDENDRLGLINYSVTYFDKSRATRYNAIKYEDWTPVNGLLLPRTLVGYVWKNDSLTTKRYEREFQNPLLSSVAKGDNFYAKPSGAYVSEKE